MTRITKTMMMTMVLMSQIQKLSTMMLKNWNYSKRKLANRKTMKVKAMKTMMKMTQTPRVSCLILKVLGIRESTSPKNLNQCKRKCKKWIESLHSSSLRETAHWCSASFSGSIYNIQETRTKWVYRLLMFACWKNELQFHCCLTKKSARSLCTFLL